MRDLLAQPAPVLIDGGLSTQLERLGHRLDDPLWTARTLLDDPRAVIAAHRAFVDAGARVVTTASYQVSRAGFVAAGRSASEADDALLAAVQAARQATAGRDVLVAASLGPYGAITHDGAEYRGRYGLSHDQLVTFHGERIEVLLAAEPDLFAVETIPDVDELRAIIEVLPRHVPAWISVTTADGAHVRAGQPIDEVASVVAGHDGLVAVGVNCSEPLDVAPLLRALRARTTLPLIAYPNAGGRWDATTRTWTSPRTAPALAVGEWIDAGASIVGGCCGTDAGDIAAMHEAISRTSRSSDPSDR